MNLMDHQYNLFPTSGARTMRSVLEDQGYHANIKRIIRLMKLMDIHAIYPQKSLTKQGQAEYVHPYLLRYLDINRSNQVWSIDISYIPMAKGFMYLVAVIDWYNKKILSWRLSNTLIASESILCVEEAISKYGVPEIVNSDQGTQYTSSSWVDFLKRNEIKISMDGRGRCKDNIAIERFWRTIKQEYIYLHPFDNALLLYQGIKGYMKYYNEKRHHQGINNEIPNVRYESLKAIEVAS